MNRLAFAAAVLPERWATLGMGLAVVAVAGLLGWANRRSWQRRHNETLAPEARAFFARQHRRRHWLNRLIGATGVAILCSPLVGHPVIRLAYWLGIALTLLCIALLAGADFVHSMFYLQTLRATHAATRKALEARLQQIDRRPNRPPRPHSTHPGQAKDGNGKHPPSRS